MNILLVKANQKRYASKGALNEALSRISGKILGAHHEILVNYFEDNIKVSCQRFTLTTSSGGTPPEC